MKVVKIGSLEEGSEEACSSCKGALWRERKKKPKKVYLSQSERCEIDLSLAYFPSLLNGMNICDVWVPLKVIFQVKRPAFILLSLLS